MRKLSLAELLVILALGLFATITLAYLYFVW